MSVVYDKEIYVFGGRDDNDSINSVEVYNVKSKKWRAANSMNSKRSRFAVRFLTLILNI